jgi:hypothetical protein
MDEFPTRSSSPPRKDTLNDGGKLTLARSPGTLEDADEGAVVETDDTEEGAGADDECSGAEENAEDAAVVADAGEGVDDEGDVDEDTAGNEEYKHDSGEEEVGRVGEMVVVVVVDTGREIEESAELDRAAAKECETAT